MIWIHFCKSFLHLPLHTSRASALISQALGGDQSWKPSTVEDLKVVVDVELTPTIQQALENDTHVWEWDDHLHNGKAFWEVGVE